MSTSIEFHWTFYCPVTQTQRRFALVIKWPSSLLPKYFPVEANFLSAQVRFNSYTLANQCCCMILWPISLKFFKFNLTKSLDFFLLKTLNFLVKIYKRISWFYVNKSHLAEFINCVIKYSFINFPSTNVAMPSLNFFLNQWRQICYSSLALRNFYKSNDAQLLWLSLEALNKYSLLLIWVVFPLFELQSLPSLLFQSISLRSFPSRKIWPWESSQFLCEC